MAIFQRIIITQKGQALTAKTMSGTDYIQFVSILVSSRAYAMDDLEYLSVLEDIKQTTLVSKVTRTNETTIKIEGAMNNIDLTEGYFCRTVGVTALDPDEGEILFGVTIAEQADYVPAFNNITMTGIKFELIISIGTSSNVTLEVNPAALVTVQQLNEATEELEALIEKKVIVSPDPPSGDGWSLWLQLEDEVPGYPDPSAPLVVSLDTAPLGAPGCYLVVYDDGTSETITNMTDDPSSAGYDDLIVIEE